MLSLMLAGYALLKRDLTHCGDQAFCHDDMSARMLSVRWRWPAPMALFRCPATRRAAAVGGACALLHAAIAHCPALPTRLQFHAGYALFEFLFWQNSALVARPWNEMLLLHDCVTLLMCIASLASDVLGAGREPSGWELGGRWPPR